MINKIYLNLVYAFKIRKIVGKHNFMNPALKMDPFVTYFFLLVQTCVVTFIWEKKILLIAFDFKLFFGVIRKYKVIIKYVETNTEKQLVARFYLFTYLLIFNLHK